MLDTNFPDMVWIINELKLLGNQTNELIIFNQDKGIADRRNPYYTWSLVDKAELLEWMIRQSKWRSKIIPYWKSFPVRIFIHQNKKFIEAGD